MEFLPNDGKNKVPITALKSVQMKTFEMSDVDEGVDEFI